MKKLLTMLSAATVALGLYAAYTPTGTSFEGGTIGEAFDIETSDDIDANTGLWATNGTPTLTVAAAGVDAVSNLRPSPFNSGEYYNNNCLQIQSTFGNPVDRNIKAPGSESSTQAIGNGFYFDSLVKFTAFDGDVPESVTNEMDAAKIAVWLQTNEDETQTNLYVRAGQFNNGVFGRWTYGCGEIVNPDGWHRLTIKAIANISSSGENPVPAFMVFVDGTAVSISDGSKPGTVDGLAAKWDAAYNNAETLFPSMVQGINGTTLESVSFDGTGWIDDVVFTETAPNFAKDPEVVTIGWDTSKIASLIINDKTYTTEGSAIVKYAAVVTVSNIVYASGWTGPSSAEVEFANPGDEGTLNNLAGEVVATFDDVGYTSLDAAIDAAYGATSDDKVLKLVKTTATDNITISNSNNRIVIDLNGQTIGKITAKSGTAVKIVDNSGTVATVSGGAKLEGAASEIAAGRYEEYVSLANGSAINGGCFKIPDDAEEAAEFLDELNSYTLPKDYKIAAGTGDYIGYYVLQPLATVTVTVTGGANATAAWLVDGASVAQAPATLTEGQTYSVEFTANTDYKFEGSPTTVFNGMVGTEAIEIAAPNAVAKVYYTAITLNKNETSIETNLTETLVATFTPASAADDTYTWASSAPAVATVDQNGVVTALAAGEATITVTATHDSSVTASCTVTVTATASSSGWVVDPTTIPENTSAATQYPALADSVLATADAKKVTAWATEYNVDFADVAAATSGTTYSDAFLLNCVPTAQAVAAATEAFEANISITFDSEGNPVVSQPTAGGYNVTPQMQGSNDLSTWNDVNGASNTYKFYKYVLSL